MRRRVLAVGAALTALLISTVGVTPTAVAGGDPNGASTPGVVRRGEVKTLPASNHVTGHWPTACKAKAQLPDPVCTPGSVSDAVTQANVKTTICTKGYTDTVRPPRSEMGTAKTVAMKAYGFPVSARATIQFDHLVPLEIGGSSDVSNLWPEYSGKSYRRKDGVEARLHNAVCGGKVTLSAAQAAVAGDWTTALTKLGIH